MKRGELSHCHVFCYASRWRMLLVLRADLESHCAEHGVSLIGRVVMHLALIDVVHAAFHLESVCLGVKES